MNQAGQMIDEKIVYLLERLSHVFRILLWEIAKKKRLSPLQIQFLQYLVNNPKNRKRVSIIAKEFGLTQATVSDAIRVLVDNGLILKKANKSDNRVFILSLTSAGRRIATEVSNWTNILTRQISSFSLSNKESAMLFLMELIKSLQEVGIIKVTRMCITCRNFKQDFSPKSDKPYYCSLTGNALSISDMNVDCENHDSIKLAKSRRQN